MKSVLLALVLVETLAASTASGRTATDKRPSPDRRAATDKALLSLDPADRVEQRCNARGMGEVGRQHRELHPDELVAYAYADPQLGKDSIKAPGAAVRSGKVWYHLSYECRTSEDGMDVKSFSFELGAAIPEEEWSKHYLVPP